MQANSPQISYTCACDRRNETNLCRERDKYIQTSLQKLHCNTATMKVKYNPRWNLILVLPSFPSLSMSGMVPVICHGIIYCTRVDWLFNCSLIQWEVIDCNLCPFTLTLRCISDACKVDVLTNCLRNAFILFSSRSSSHCRLHKCQYPQLQPGLHKLLSHPLPPQTPSLWTKSDHLRVVVKIGKSAISNKTRDKPPI